MQCGAAHGRIADLRRRTDLRGRPADDRAGDFSDVGTATSGNPASSSDLEPDEDAHGGRLPHRQTPRAGDAHAGAGERAPLRHAALAPRHARRLQRALVRDVRLRLRRHLRGRSLRRPARARRHRARHAVLAHVRRRQSPARRLRAPRRRGALAPGRGAHPHHARRAHLRAPARRSPTSRRDCRRSTIPTTRRWSDLLGELRERLRVRDAPRRPHRAARAG